jgi:hypothetical protein
MFLDLSAILDPNFQHRSELSAGFSPCENLLASAGDQIQTGDVQLGKIESRCKYNTYAFMAFIQTKKDHRVSISSEK